MQKPKKGRNSILWVEGVGFSILIVMSWLTEIFRIPHLIFGEPYTPNWLRAILRTIVISGIWLWVVIITQRLLKRLHYLEEFLRICSWCRKVCHNEEWLGLEAYFNSKFSTRTSHGMCPECMKKKIEELSLDQPAPTPETRGEFKSGLN